MANQGELPVTASAAPATNQTVCASEIMELIQGERNDACTYFALAKYVGGKDCACCNRVSPKRSLHAKRLSTVYYVLTGNRACVCPEPTEPVTCLPESLRQTGQQEPEGRREPMRPWHGGRAPHQNLFWQPQRRGAAARPEGTVPAAAVLIEKRLQPSSSIHSGSKTGKGSRSRTAFAFGRVKKETLRDPWKCCCNRPQSEDGAPRRFQAKAVSPTFAQLLAALEAVTDGDAGFGLQIHSSGVE